MPSPDISNATMNRSYQPSFPWALSLTISAAVANIFICTTFIILIQPKSPHIFRLRQPQICTIAIIAFDLIAIYWRIGIWSMGQYRNSRESCLSVDIFDIAKWYCIGCFIYRNGWPTHGTRAVWRRPGGGPFIGRDLCVLHICPSQLWHCQCRIAWIRWPASPRAALFAKLFSVCYQSAEPDRS